MNTSAHVNFAVKDNNAHAAGIEASQRRTDHTLIADDVFPLPHWDVKFAHRPARRTSADWIELLNVWRMRQRERCVPLAREHRVTGSNRRISADFSLYLSLGNILFSEDTSSDNTTVAL